MSEQDEPDVVEQAPRAVRIPRWIPTGKRSATITAVVVVGALLAVGGTLAAVRLTAHTPTDPALTRLITEVTTVPVGSPAPADPALNPENAGPPTTPVSSGPSAYSSTLLIDPDTPITVHGPPLTAGGRPEVLYVASGYCPYCAEENWPLIVALSRFGQFTGLTTSRTPQFEDVPPIDTWTFYGSSYTSSYLDFVPVETHSNVLVSPTANPDKASSYRVLQRLTPAEEAVFHAYDKAGLTPFIDFGGRAVQVGSGVLPNLVGAGRGSSSPLPSGSRRLPWARRCSTRRTR